MRNSPLPSENPLLGGSQGDSLPKQVLLDSLLSRFGSRRAVIEEIDRLKRLRMLKPAVKGEIRIKNQPNPEWREIDTPSLLISGEKISETTTLLSATSPPRKMKTKRSTPKPKKKQT